MNNTQHDNLTERISDEDLRLRIRELIPEKRESNLQRRSKHPLVILMIGFILTTVLGGSIAQYFQKKSETRRIEQEKRDEQRLDKQEIKILRLRSIAEITDLIYERHARVSLLASSIKRSADISELKERKKLYDEAYIKWNSKLQSVQLKIREITQSKTYSTFEARIQFELVPLFNKLDDFVTEGYDAKMNGRKFEYPSTVTTTIKACLDCCYSITNDLWSTTYNEDSQNVMTKND